MNRAGTRTSECAIAARSAKACGRAKLDGRLPRGGGRGQATQQATGSSLPGCAHSAPLRSRLIVNARQGAAISQGSSRISISVTVDVLSARRVGQVARRTRGDGARVCGATQAPDVGVAIHEEHVGERPVTEVGQPTG